MSEKTITVNLQQQADYRFEIVFDDAMPVLTTDEPAPLGTGTGPSPVQLLCAAVERGEPTLIDPYGAEDPTEFLAVAALVFGAAGVEAELIQAAL